jgi:tetratricopeptide (TPR) repeat protein
VSTFQQITPFYRLQISNIKILIKLISNSPLFLRIFGLALIGLSLFFFLYAQKSIEAHRNWRLANTAYQLKAYKYSIDYFSQAHSHLKSNGEFLLQYGKALYFIKDYHNSIEILKRANSIFPNSLTHTSIGDNYRALGDFEKAEGQYIKASNMVPGRIFPKYLLAKIYLENGNIEKAKETAIDILNQKIKIESKAVEQIIVEMKAVVKIP